MVYEIIMFYEKTSGHENKAFDGDSEVTISHHENPSKVGVSQLENQLDIPERKPWDSKWEFLMSCISLVSINFNEKFIEQQRIQSFIL